VEQDAARQHASEPLDNEATNSHAICPLATISPRKDFARRASEVRSTRLAAEVTRAASASAFARRREARRTISRCSRMGGSGRGIAPNFVPLMLDWLTPSVLTWRAQARPHAELSQ